MIQWRKVRVPKRVLYLCIGVTCAVLLIIVIVYGSNIMGSSGGGMAMDAQFPLATKRTSLAGVGYVFLALGAQANQMNCPAAIESLVKYGGWDGNIYLITDRTDCFNKQQIIANAGIASQKFHMIRTKESYSDGGIDFYHSHMGTRKNRIRSFSVKAQIFDYVTDPAIEVLVYADCDVLFGLPDCAAELPKAALPFRQEAIKLSRVYRNSSNHNNVYNLHSGAFVAHRNYSSFILKQWRHELERYIFEHDRDALISAHYIGKAAHLPTYQYELNEFPRDFERFFDQTTAKQPVCINHISKTRCAAEGREVVQKFVDRFNLESYSHKYYYCPHPRLQPLLYGWFPFSYVPFCPKVEAWM